MPFAKAWVPDPDDASRNILRLTNNTIWEANNIVVLVLDKGRAFTYPGPMAVGASHDFWNTPLLTPPDVANMVVLYDSILGLGIREPLL